jgi:hypothetical protein
MIKPPQNLLYALLHGTFPERTGWPTSIGFLRLSPVEIPILEDRQPPSDLTAGVQCLARLTRKPQLGRDKGTQYVASPE